MDKSFFRRYTNTIIIGVIVVLPSMLLINYLVDPYAIFNSPRSERFNRIKPCVSDHIRLSKAHIIKNLKPDAIIIGSSRAYRGLDPEHPAFKSLAVYNASLTGANIYEVMRYFQYANSVNPLRQVVLAIDFFQFNGYWRNKKDFSEDRLTSRDGERLSSFYPLSDGVSALASLDAMVCTYKTVFNQHRQQIFQLENGMQDMHFQEAVQRRKGWRNTFINGQRHFNISYQNSSDYTYYTDLSGHGITTFDYFRKILDESIRNGIDLRIIVSPSHAWQWEGIASVGLWDEWENWKRELVKINEQTARSYGRQSFPLWDFSGYNKYTMEAVPLSQDVGTPMKWYWDPSHYRVELGDVVLNRVFGYSDTNLTVKDDFGILLTPDNINSHLKNIRDNRKLYRFSNSEDIHEIESLWSAAP